MVQRADKLAALNQILLIISIEFAKEFCLPGSKLTLVGELIRDIKKLGDEHLEELLYLFEIGKIEVLEEIRQREDAPRRADLRLILSEKED